MGVCDGCGGGGVGGWKVGFWQTTRQSHGVAVIEQTRVKTDRHRPGRPDPLDLDLVHIRYSVEGRVPSARRYCTYFYSSPTSFTCLPSLFLKRKLQSSCNLRNTFLFPKERNSLKKCWKYFFIFVLSKCTENCWSSGFVCRTQGKCLQ